MSQAITLELTADRANSLASILKAFLLLNPHKPGLLTQEAYAFLNELGELPEPKPQAVIEILTPQQQFLEPYTDAGGNVFSDADPSL